MKLTDNLDNVWFISTYVGVIVLLKICVEEDSILELVDRSYGILKSLTIIEEIKRFMADEETIFTLIKLD